MKQLLRDAAICSISHDLDPKLAFTQRRAHHVNTFPIHILRPSPAAMIRRLVLLPLLFAVTLPAPVAAQRVTAFSLRWDNDFLAPRGSGKPEDRDYTQGFEAAFEIEPGSAARPAYRIAVGQRIYTPRVDGETPVPGERPYAGWLYAAASRQTTARSAELTFGAEIGITGPAALGEVVQNTVHQLTGSERQRGWANQLAFEPAFAASVRAAVPRRLGIAAIRPYAQLTTGTLRTAAEAGVRAGAGGQQGVYVDGGAGGAWVARDLFVDGNTFRKSVRADRRPFTAAADVAAGYRWTHAAFEYRVTARGREYDAQRSPHVIGSIRVSWMR